MPKSDQRETIDPALKELQKITRLLTLFLMKTDASQEEIAMALEVDRSVVSRMIPSRKVKSYRAKA